MAPPGQRGGSDADRDGGGGQGVWRRGQFPDAAIVSHLRDAELSRPAAGAAVPGKNRKTDRGGEARRHPYRDRRPDRTVGAALLPQAWPAIHDKFSHPFSGVCIGAFANSGIVGMAGAAHLPPAEPGGDGGNAGAGGRIAHAGLSQRGAVVARRRYRAVSSAPHRSLPADAGVPQRRAHRGRKEPRSLPRPRSARHQARRRRRAGPCRAGAEISGRRVPGRKARRGIGRNLRGVAMFSCFPAGPTRLAWCCWRRWPAACRLPPFRSQVHAM